MVTKFIGAFVVSLLMGVAVACGDTTPSPTPAPLETDMSEVEFGVGPCITTLVVPLPIEFVYEGTIPTGFDGINKAACTFTKPVKMATVKLTGPVEHTETFTLGEPTTDVSFPLPEGTLSITTQEIVPPGEYQREITVTSLDGETLTISDQPGVLTTVTIVEPDESVSHGGPVTDYVSLVDNLRAAGATVDPAGTVMQPFFVPQSQLLTVNGEDVQVFEFDSGEEAATAASTVSADGSSIGATMVTWVAPPRFYQGGKLIVIYVGSGGGVIDILTAVMGTQFAGRSPAAMTPTPTAMPTPPILPTPSTIPTNTPTRIGTLGGENWEFAENDIIGEKVTKVIFSFASSGQTRFGDAYKLVIGCIGPDEYFWIDLYWLTFIGIEPHVEATYRIDSQEPRIVNWNLSPQGTNTYLVDESAKDFVQGLLEANQLAMSVTSSGESSLTAVFDLLGIGEAIEPVREACPF